MSASVRSKSGSETLTQAEATLVDLVRLVMRGEQETIPRRVSRLLGSAASRRPDALSDGCKKMLRDALDEAPRVGRGTGLRRQGFAATTATSPDIVHVEETPEGPMPVLPPGPAAAIEQIITEHEQRAELARAGLEPTSTILLSGAPGVGKTMTAIYLARRLNLPLLRAEPSSIITSLLGESARNMTTALAEGRREPCVFLLDEVDAFAKRRDDAQDVGELKRFVTTLLVELDRWPSSSILIAATNHPQLLDPALGRRFQQQVVLPLPDHDARERLLRDAVESRGFELSSYALQLATATTEGRSGSELKDIAEAAARRSVLAQEHIDLALVRAALPKERGALTHEQRREFARLAKSLGRLSTRDIGDLLGVSHVTVSRLHRDEVKRG